MTEIRLRNVKNVLQFFAAAGSVFFSTDCPEIPELERSSAGEEADGAETAGCGDGAGVCSVCGISTDTAETAGAAAIGPEIEDSGVGRIPLSLPDKRQKGDSGRNAFPGGVESERSPCFSQYFSARTISFSVQEKSAIDDRVESR